MRFPVFLDRNTGNMADTEDGLERLDANKASSTDGANKQIKSYDLAMLLKVSRGNQDFVKTMIKMFILKTPIYIERINNAFAAADYVEMGEAAHQLKQSVYALGINNIRVPVMSIILAGRKNENNEDLQGNIAMLKMSAENVIQEIKKDFGY
jgi:HPt (histidine-containing phosphotransfer) domain-containing protein